MLIPVLAAALLLPGPPPAQPEVLRTTLDGGPEIALVPRPGAPWIHVEVAFPLPPEAQPADRPGLVPMALNGLLGEAEHGTFGPALEGFEDRVDGLEFHLEPTGLRIAFDVQTARLRPAMRALGLQIAAPRFDRTEMSKAARSLGPRLAQRRDEPPLRARIALLESLVGGHALAQVVGGVGTAPSEGHAVAAKALFSRWWTADQLKIVLVGEFDPDTAVHVLEQSFDSVRTPPTPPDRAPAPQLRAPLLALRPVEGLHESHVALGWASAALSPADDAVGTLLREVLVGGPGSRLGAALRRQRGLTYEVGGAWQSLGGLSVLSAWTAVAPERLGEAIASAQAEVARLRTEPVSQAELDRARGRLFGRMATDRGTAAGLGASLAVGWLAGAAPGADAGWFDALSAVTPEDLLDLAQRLLREDALGLAVVGDPSAAEQLRDLALPAHLQVPGP